MSLPHIILSQLELRDGLTGYDITVAFKGNIGLTWVASHQQVYRELAKLEGDALCFHVVEPQVGKPDRKVFTITAKGQEFLDEWRSKELRAEGYRDKLGAKIFACKGADTSNAIKLLREEVDMVSKEIERVGKCQPEDDIDGLLIDRRLFQLKSRREWAERAIERLK